MLETEIREILADGETVYLFQDDDHYYVERGSLVGKTTDKTDVFVCVIREIEDWLNR